MCNDSQTINVNAEEVRQVLLNILTNSIDALKGMKDKKQIIVSCNPSKTFMSVNITNNGPEIPLSTIQTIFEPFYTTKKSGTGIGLHVCKQIIENYGGKIECHSTHDLTTFTVLLPYSVSTTNV
ncbi:MAG: ATP-binding protein [Bacillaceae bacterium]|nr:ATP-binding protein [Bacillaceae bacterium]